MKVDIEAPYQGIVTMDLNDAVRRYWLDENDIENLKEDKIVWIGETAITKSEEVE